MPRQVALYLDTSVPNALFQEPRERQELTALFFRTVVPRFDGFVSELVVAEIDATPDSTRRDLLLGSISGLSVLEASPEAEELAQAYLQHLRIPDTDALHVAIAAVEGVDYLVTWNMKHLARERTRRVVENTSVLRGLRRVLIVTPADLLEEW